MVGIERDLTSEEEEGPFLVNLAIVTEVPEVYVYLRNLRVVRAEVERLDGTKPPITVMKADEVDAIVAFELSFKDTLKQPKAEVLPFKPKD
jgi:hypothetical protein